VKRVGEGVLHVVGKPSLLTFYKKFILNNSKCINKNKKYKYQMEYNSKIL